MKIECLKEKIELAITRAEKATGKNLTLPVLGCLLLESKKNTLLIKATNLDVGVEISVPVRGIEDGKVAVPASILSGFISTLNGARNLTLETKDGVLVIDSGNIKVSVKCLPVDDFPVIPKLTEDGGSVVSTEILLKGLKSVWYSAAVSGMKPELSSVFVDSNGSVVRFVATDSFRLAEKKLKIKDFKELQHILVPVKNILEVIRIFDGSNENIKVAASKNQISLSAGGVYLTSRVIDGNFPDYEQIIPKEFDTEVTILKQDLIQTIKVANIFSDDFNQINIKVSPNKKVLEIRTKNGAAGEAVNKLDAAISGKEVDINFNFKYIADALQAIETDSVTLNFAGAHKPMVMRGVGDQSFTYLVMPLNR